MPDLDTHGDSLRAAIAAARAAPLSAKRALLAVMLADAYADRLFVPTAEADDILEFRGGLAKASPALALVFEVAAQRLQLVTEAVAVPLAEYGQLTVQDFMVSLYNDHSVQRVRIALPDGSRPDVHAVLAEALLALERAAGSR